jgi:glyoxylase-like metal-dependent hydrolase (beta-lactamase superfamily II)
MASLQIHEVGKEFFLLRSSETDFHRNIFIKRFISGNERANLICDPGTRLDIATLMEALDKLIGGAQNLNAIFLSHQDPDVSSNTLAMLGLAPRATVITSIDTWRLVKMYGIPENRFYGAESFKDSVLQVKATGHKIKLVPAHYCHFRGALMLYDIESRVLFSGDLLGGLNTRKGDGIWADEASWPGISLFHQVYMPSHQALELAIGRIASLRPEPLVIAPQHGDVIRGELVTEFAARLASLDVALDLQGKTGPVRDLTLLCINDFLDAVRNRDANVHRWLLDELQAPRGFTTLFSFTSGTLTELKVSPEAALSVLGETLARLTPDETATTLKSLLRTSVEQYALVPPPELAASSATESGSSGSEATPKSIFG